PRAHGGPGQRPAQWRKVTVMSTYLSVGGGGGPDEAIEVATRMRSAGDDFTETTQPLVHSIEAIEARRPWGDGDDYAKAFLKNYHGDGPMPTNEAVKKSLGDAGSSLSHIGTNVIEAMAKYQITDDEGASAIKATVVR